VGWWEAIKLFLGLGKNVTDIVKNNQEEKKTTAIEKQGEANATAKSNAETLDAVRTSNRANTDPVIDDFVRSRWERP